MSIQINKCPDCGNTPKIDSCFEGHYISCECGLNNKPISPYVTKEAAKLSWNRIRS